MRNRIRLALTTIILMLAAAPRVAASEISFFFEGTVTSVVTDPGDPFAGAIAFGTSFFGFYAPTDLLASDTGVGAYQFLGSPAIDRKSVV